MINKFEENLKKSVQQLEIATNSYYNLNLLAKEICKGLNNKAIIKLYKSLNDILKSDKNYLKLCSSVKNNLIIYYGAYSISNIITTYKENIGSDKSLNGLIEDLNRLIGLKNVKEKVQDLIALQKVQNLRKKNGLHSPTQTLHMAFIGNPGTGKTTVARIVGRIYKHLGLLSKGHFVEVSRTDLIAGYQGQTALKVKKVIDKSLGGVLFIDEAYSITENENSDSYGKECLTELTKALEDHRNDLVVIVAGYREPMNLFFNSNPGLKSRFNTFIEFDDFNDRELYEILELMCNQNNYKLTDSAKSKIKNILTELTLKKEKNFGNARLIRNIYDDLVLTHAKRVFKIKKPSIEQLQEVISEDII
jgi:SpoVK/Ycf46/Vps4 family AAA+-type ATPase